ncbi:metal-sensitive transcriptional regulator [Candidatus Kaiserbacteria bacterium]|nr:metal-sensitive transcriptional regulator [Candidatus Kaiserbacteria bacterium]
MKIALSENRQKVMNRLKRVEGQVRAVQGMLECEKECADIATQLSACRSAIEQTLGVFVACAIEESSKGQSKKDTEDIKRLLQLIV